MNTNLSGRITHQIVACMLLASVAGGASAATATLTIDGQRQRASMLCWAATSAMAVNWFDIADGKVTQAQLAAYRGRGIETRAQYQALSTPYKTWVDSHVTQCDTNISQCDQRNIPLLFGLTSRTGNEGQALTWADLRKQIDDKRPVMFTWVYLKTTQRREFEHQFIILGYRTQGSAKEVLVWDPMPVHDPLQAVTFTTLQASTSRWISYDIYKNPGNDAGRMARHGYTTYHLAVEGTTISLPLPVLTGTLPAVRTIDDLNPARRLAVSTGRWIYNDTDSNPVIYAARKAVEGPTLISLPPTVLADAMPAVKLHQAVSFDDALLEAEKELRRLEVELNATTKPARRLGTPMPIIALEDGNLIEDRDPTSLLAGKTSTLLVPVLTEAGVEDAFLLIRESGHWRRGGYVELEVAQLLLAQRDRSARDLRVAPAKFFAVSMPQRATFFAAYGYREAAQLFPITSDPGIGTRAGRPRLAAEQLGDIGRRILSTPGEREQRKNPATGAPVRPLR